MGNKPYGWVIERGPVMPQRDEAIAVLPAQLGSVIVAGLDALLQEGSRINPAGIGRRRLVVPASELIGAGWSLTGSDAFKDTTTVFSGDSSLRYFFDAGGAAADWQGIVTADPVAGNFCVPLKPGLTYRLQLSTRTDSVAGSPQYRIVVTHDRAGTLTSVKTITFGGANAWQTDQFLFAVPAGALPNSQVAIQFQRGATAAQNFWVDSIRMDEIGQRLRCRLYHSAAQTVTNLVNL